MLRDDEEPPASLLFEIPASRRYVPPQDSDDEQVPDSIQFEPESWSLSDTFLVQIYTYYQSKGLMCILLSRVTYLATCVFVVTLSTFLIHCVNYSIPKHNLGESLYPNCAAQIHWITWIALGMFGAWLGLLTVRFALELPKWQETRVFYTNVLKIDDCTLQSILWNEVVHRIIASRTEFSATHPQTRLRPLDSHQIANLIMRKENYMIALFNKDILPLRVNVPFVGEFSVLSNLMEWNLSFCLFDFVFDEKGIFKQKFLRESNRHVLVQE